MSALTDVEKNNALGTRFLIGDTLFAGDEIAKVKVLHAYESANYATPREVGSTSGYLVPSGKKFVVCAVRVQVQSGTANSLLGILSATQDVGFSSASQPTGADNTIAAFDGQFHALATTASILLEQSFPMVVPENRYLYVSSGSGQCFWHIFGFEVDADAATI